MPWTSHVPLLASRLDSAVGARTEPEPDLYPAQVALPTLIDRAEAHLRETIIAQQLVAQHCLPGVALAAELIRDAFLTGRKLLLCGNGGSAADCQHVAAEFVGHLRAEFERPGLPAIALTTDTSFLTAFANDCDFDGVFARQLGALAQPGDVLLAISTSGRSRNVLLALDVAWSADVRTIGLFGAGGPALSELDVLIAVPSRNTQVIQECMLSIEHTVCELVEEALFGNLRPGLGGPTS
jgi:D-sedoheptulose 7-phosphate isomerase